MNERVMNERVERLIGELSGAAMDSFDELSDCQAALIEERKTTILSVADELKSLLRKEETDAK